MTFPFLFPPVVNIGTVFNIVKQKSDLSFSWIKIRLCRHLDDASTTYHSVPVHWLRGTAFASQVVPPNHHRFVASLAEVWISVTRSKARCQQSLASAGGPREGSVSCLFKFLVLAGVLLSIQSLRPASSNLCPVFVPSSHYLFCVRSPSATLW